MPRQCASRHIGAAARTHGMLGGVATCPVTDCAERSPSEETAVDTKLYLQRDEEAEAGLHTLAAWADAHADKLCSRPACALCHSMGNTAGKSPALQLSTLQLLERLQARSLVCLPAPPRSRCVRAAPGNCGGGDRQQASPAGTAHALGHAGRLRAAHRAHGHIVRSPAREQGNVQI